MTTYRHARETANFGWCLDCSLMSDERGLAPCTTPTPDPASPCGHPTCNQRAIAHVHMGAHGVYGRHPHVPTRCTCGHPLEATR